MCDVPESRVRFGKLRTKRPEDESGDCVDNW
jgi:hypothetical protein